MKKALQKHENKANAKLVCFLRNIVYVIVWEGLRALPKHLKYKREGTETLPYVFGYWMLDAEGINAFPTLNTDNVGNGFIRSAD